MRKEKRKMKNEKTRNICPLLFFFLFSLLSFNSCISVIETAGSFIDGSVFDERVLSVYRAEGIELTLAQNRQRENFVVITLDEYPMMRLRGTAPNEKGEFYLTSLEYLGGSVNGWNEFSLGLLSEGYLLLTGFAVLEIKEAPEKVEIDYGRIQRNDTRIIGPDALSLLRNRRERIEAIVEWMKSREDAPQAMSFKNFERYWVGVLFPEMAAARRRPQGWRQAGDVFVRNEDIRWNTGYTQRVFPESLHSVRNSGTMFRDWEEALAWIYLEYEWDNLVSILLNRNHLQKTR